MTLKFNPTAIGVALIAMPLAIQAQAGSVVNSAPACQGATPVKDATCISGGTASKTDALGNTTYSAWAQSSCSAYATIKVGIVVSGGTIPKHIVLDDATRVETTSADEIRGVTCCWDDGKICYKDQVEANESGEITRRGKTATTEFSHRADVSTAWSRYFFCEAYPGDIYCQVDPQGDALVQPEIVVPEGSTMKDCFDNYESSTTATATEGDRCTGVSIARPTWKGDDQVPHELRTHELSVLDDENCAVYGLKNCTIGGETWDASDELGMLDENNHTGMAALVYVPVDDMDEVKICQIENEFGIVLRRGHAGTCPDSD